MKIVIIGNGVAGTFTAQNIRNLDKNVDIEIVSEEKYRYYSRPKLPELISGKISIDDLFVFDENWYKKRDIKTTLGRKITKIFPKQKRIFFEDQEEYIDYDKLIIASGSKPNIPPIKNAQNLLKKGVFSLRSIDDALELRNYIKNKNVDKAIIIGGGLLGLELSKQIRNCNLDTMVVEFFPRLLPRQLDDECAGMLKKQIEDMGIKIILNTATEEILGVNSVRAIKIKGPQEIDTDIVLIQAGIRPRIDLAKHADIQVNRGIIVNEFLQTNKRDIFAVGDVIEYKSQTWGIIPACIEQSRIVASSVLDKKEVAYKGTTPKTTLKIVGIDVCSVGIFSPPEEEQPDWEILKKVDKETGCYQKLILKEGKLKGAILFGEKKSIPFVNRNINLEVNREEINKLLDVYFYYCPNPNCNYVYDEAKEGILFKKLPETFKCPSCGSSISSFIKK